MFFHLSHTGGILCQRNLRMFELLFCRTCCNIKPKSINTPTLQNELCWERISICIFIQIVLISHMESVTSEMVLFFQMVIPFLASRRTIYSYFDFGLRNSSFQFPYQRHSSSADYARELFKGSNGSASLLDCTRKKFFGSKLRIF